MGGHNGFRGRSAVAVDRPALWSPALGPGKDPATLTYLYP